MIPNSHSSVTDNYGVLIASSNSFLRRQIIENLPPNCRPVEEAQGGAEALGKLELSDCRTLLLDRHLPDLNVEELTAMVRLRYPGVDVRTIDGDATGVPALWHTGPARPERALGSTPVENVVPLEGMVGKSPAMASVYRAIRRVAPRDTAVLVTGETGTGKELIAQAIHRLSPRNEKPIVVINCAAIPETLLESELFGYVRGAFTGAAQSRLGRIQAAHGGTLFLDEIGEMPTSLQAKLLRFLESGELQRLGSAETWKADVRVVTATNQDLCDAQSFRRDLYYRLCVFPVTLPPLRERREDIEELAEHFLHRFSPRGTFTESALKKLIAYDWPGNVRELKHVIERATILCSGELITAEELALRSKAAIA
jgi:transcriptional regulator with GAF, ATPase, and Fis domain